MNSRFEKYLMQVERRLSELPATERQNEIREMRDHMEEIFQEQQEVHRAIFPKC